MYKHCISSISPGVVWPWWTFTKRHPSLVTTCRTMLRLLTGNHEIAERLRRNGTSRTCQQCTMMVTDSIPHMLFECASGSERRRNLWSDVINNSPKVLSDKMSEMNFRERSNFLLSGFYSPEPVIEWESMYISVSLFINTMYENKITLMNLSDRF